MLLRTEGRDGTLGDNSIQLQKLVLNIGTAFDEDTTGSVPVTVSLSDTDGSEVIAKIEVAGVPEGWQLSLDGATATFDDDTGLWTLTGAGIEAGGNFNFRLTPPANVNGSATLVVTAYSREESNDDAAASDPVTVEVWVTPVNDAPIVAVVNPAAGSEKDMAEIVSFNLLADLTTISDVDEGDAQDFVNCSASVSAASGSASTDTSLISIDQATGAVSYDRAAFNFLAAGKAALYTIEFDVRSGPDVVTKSVTLRIDGENDGPAANDDASTVLEGATRSKTIAFGVLGNDTDVDRGDTRIVASVEGEAGNVGAAVAGDYGTLTLRANGSYSYVANLAERLNPGQEPRVDGFSYAISDGQGGTDAATLSITVSGKENLVVGTAGADTLTGGEGDTRILGLDDDDRLTGREGKDRLFGGDGDDLLDGQGGDD